MHNLLAHPERKEAITTAYLHDLHRLPGEFTTGIVTELACMSPYGLLSARRHAAGAPAALTRAAVRSGIPPEEADAYRQWVGLVLTVEPDQLLAFRGLAGRFPAPDLYRVALSVTHDAFGQLPNPHRAVSDYQHAVGLDQPLAVEATRPLLQLARADAPVVHLIVDYKFHEPLWDRQALAAFDYAHDVAGHLISQPGPLTRPRMQPFLDDLQHLATGAIGCMIGELTHLTRRVVNEEIDNAVEPLAEAIDRYIDPQVLSPDDRSRLIRWFADLGWVGQRILEAPDDEETRAALLEEAELTAMAAACTLNSVYRPDLVLAEYIAAVSGPWDQAQQQ